MVWFAAAWGGPLDRPDPMDMGPLFCAERPLGLANNAPLDQRKLGDGPPGPPVLPPALQSSLQPYASDDALASAAKKKTESLAALSSLATEGAPVTRWCEGPPADIYDFTSGCRSPRRCTDVATLGGRTVSLSNRSQAAAAFAPVESAKEALGILALVDDALFLPLTPAELAAWSVEAAGYRAVLPEIAWVEVVERPGGWIVRAPRKVVCGCEHDVVRRAYFVSKDGRSCPIQGEAAVPLAVAVDPICAD